MFVPGEPVLSGGRGQSEWQAQIAEGIDPAIEHPKLTFVVNSLRRRGHPFDLDNLVHPVLMVLDDPVRSVSARLHVGDNPGLLIEDELPSPPATVERSVAVPIASKSSDRNRKGIPSIANDAVLDEHEGIGVWLAFDAEDIPIRRGWFGPTEAVIDDLVPWLGTYTAANLIADHRIRDLRIVRGSNPDDHGVDVRVWYVPDEDVPIPSELHTRLPSP